MPSELENASSIDLVMYCVYAMNDPSVSKLGPYTLNELFFKSVASLNKPIEIPSKLRKKLYNIHHFLSSFVVNCC